MRYNPVRICPGRKQCSGAGNRDENIRPAADYFTQAITPVRHKNCALLKQVRPTFSVETRICFYFTQKQQTMKTIWIVGSLAIVLLSAFYTAGKNIRSNLPDQPDTSYVSQTTYINLGEVDAGNLAIQRSSNTAVKSFGEMLVNDHQKAQTDLMNIAKNAGYDLPAETDQEHKDLLSMLQTLNGPAFDSAFIYTMLQGHDKAIMVQQNEMQTGSDQALKDYAAGILPVITMHRDHADSLARMLFPAEAASPLQ